MRARALLKRQYKELASSDYFASKERQGRETVSLDVLRLASYETVASLYEYHISGEMDFSAGNIGSLMVW
jgi:hypothetical protein